MLCSSEEATTNEMGSIEQHQPLQSTLSCILNKPPSPAFKNYKKTLNTAYISDPFIQPHRLKAISRRSQAKPMKLICLRKWQFKFKNKPNLQNRRVSGQHRESRMSYNPKITQRPMFECEIRFILRVISSVTTKTSKPTYTCNKFTSYKIG